MINKVYLSFFLVVFLASSVVAFGVGAEYWTDRQLEMMPGQTAETFFEIQNPEDVEIVVQGNLLEGSEVASLIDGPDYSVDSKEKNRAVVRVTIPESASIGDRYTIKAVFKQISPVAGEGEGVQFSFNVAKEFDVLVVKEAEVQEVEAPQGTNFWYWVIGIIILIIIIWFAMKAMKK